jgi:hypothetical protein
MKINRQLLDAYLLRYWRVWAGILLPFLGTLNAHYAWVSPDAAVVIGLAAAGAGIVMHHKGDPPPPAPPPGTFAIA